MLALITNTAGVTTTKTFPSKLHRRTILFSDSGILWQRASHSFLGFKASTCIPISKDGTDASSVYCSTLKGCGKRKAVFQGKRIHAQILNDGFGPDVRLGNYLVDMYQRCTDVVEAQKAFYMMAQKDVVSWTTMLAAYIHLGYYDEATQLFSQMLGNGMKPNRITFIIILNACHGPSFLGIGKSIHQLILVGGFVPDVILETALIGMYGKCGSLENAVFVFNQMQVRDVVSWNALCCLYFQQGQYNVPLILFTQMLSEGVKPNLATFLSLINACNQVEVKFIHAYIIASGLEAEISIETALLNVYGKHGNLHLVRNLFRKAQQGEASPWNATIGAYGQNGHIKEALKLFSQMLFEGVKPNRTTFITVLSICSTLTEGSFIHVHIMKNGYDTDVVMETAILTMYTRCGTLKDAIAMFDRMRQRNLASWNSLMVAYSQVKVGNVAIQICQAMQLERLLPNEVTFIVLLSTCSSPKGLSNGKLLHGCIIIKGYHLHLIVSNALLNMYGKCGSLDIVHSIFRSMPEHDNISWNTAIETYAQHGHGLKAFHMFRKMYLEGMLFDNATLTSVLHACSSMEALGSGKLVHACISNIEFDAIVTSALLDMYGKCRSLSDAFMIINNLLDWDTSSWNLLIALFARNDHNKEASSLFQKMYSKGIEADEITFSTILSTCTTLEWGRFIHVNVIACGLELDSIVGNALLNMYSKCGSPRNAESIFDKIHPKDVISWTTMISVYAQPQYEKDALELFQNMQANEVKPNRITFSTIIKACTGPRYLFEGRLIHSQILGHELELDHLLGTSLINMYGICQSIADARETFVDLHGGSSSPWNAMITAFVRCGYASEGLHLLRQMHVESVMPDKFTFVNALEACASIAATVFGKMIHASMITRSVEFDIILENSLLNMYCKCSNIQDAHYLFDYMAQRDIITWNTIIAGHAQHGHCQEVSQICSKMEQAIMEPNSATLVSMLSACSHAGLIDSVWHYFLCICGDHRTAPIAEHYGCLIDLFGRAGHLEEAEDLIGTLLFQDVVGWTSFLGACRVHQDLKRGEGAAKHALELDSNNAASYVTLSNILWEQ